MNGLKDRGFTLKLAGRNGARGRIRTYTGDVLDVVSLLLDYASKANGASCRCCSGRISLQKKSAGCCMEAKWSQSPVLPWARLAYDACLNAGSTAIFEKWSPHPELHRTGSHTKGVHRSKCFGGMKSGVPDRLRSGDLLHERQACWLDYTTGTDMVRVSGNAPDPGTDLVRCEV